MSRAYRLYERASRDSMDIYLFGIEYFGLRQASYLDELEDCFALLADNPRMGRPAERLGHGVRRHEHGSHVILYRIMQDGILVLALVHGRNVEDLEL